MFNNGLSYIILKLVARLDNKAKMSSLRP